MNHLSSQAGDLGGRRGVGEVVKGCPQVSVKGVDENLKGLLEGLEVIAVMGGTGLPPELMKEHGADVLLCRGIGSRAMDMCRDFGIDVYVFREGTVREMFRAWKEGRIEKAGADDACKRHS